MKTKIFVNLPVERSKSLLKLDLSPQVTDENATWTKLGSKMNKSNNNEGIRGLISWLKLKL